VQAYQGFDTSADWDVAPDGLSVLQRENSLPSLFCSDFDATGTSLEGEIFVDTTFDDDFIGFALGYNTGDNVDPNASWYLIDWKKSTQTWEFSDCGYTEATGLAGFSISEVTGIPIEAEFWAHSNLSCNQFGGLSEIQRGINYGSVGWVDLLTYQFRFEVSPTQILAYVNDQLELNVTGSFNTTGNFCYYNLSQERVRYSGLTSTKETVPPSPAPSESINATPPVCEVLEVTTVILGRASDEESGILSLTLHPPNADLVLTSNFTAGELDVVFSVSIVNNPGQTDYRESAVVVENRAGSTCVFPTIGSILDEDCSNNDECQPDLAIEFPFPTSNPGIPSFNFSSVATLVQPSFADIDFNETSLLYVPRWKGILYDAFALEGKTVYGDTFILSAEYYGSNQTVDVQIDIIGQWFDYIWFDEDYDEEGARRLANKQPALAIEWHHEIPKGVFGDGKKPSK
jgi:Thrombospondin C-terminal region